MSPDRFKHMLLLVARLISKQTTRNISWIHKRLVVTLRYLATGETEQSLGFGYRIGKPKMTKILAETSETIFQTLKEQFL